MDTDQNEAQGLPIKFAELTERIIGVYYAVYNELGHGFLEGVYQRAMAIALAAEGLHIACEVPISVWFRGVNVGDFRADLVVEEKILVELKAAQALDRTHEAQVLNYLRATRLELALLFNFGPRPQFRRILLDNERKSIRVYPCESVVKQK